MGTYFVSVDTINIHHWGVWHFPQIYVDTASSVRISLQVHRKLQQLHFAIRLTQEAINL